ncbi:MAG TPA: hypothetical protein VF692_08810 [Pyrinomonadaceae bacterium]|jgi:hypothetical protein
MRIFKKKKETPTLVWARPEMLVVFRAQVMPGKSREERTFRVEEFLPNGRVTLHDFAGKHLENEFEATNFLREKTK